MPSRHPRHGGGDDPARGGDERILVCEDDEAVRDLTVAFLRGAGYEVHAAENGESALSRAVEIGSPIDLLVTDVVMPGLNGKQLAEAMAKEHGVTRTLYVSGYAAAVIARHGIIEAGVEFLAKPFTRQTLLNRVREVLDQPAPAAFSPKVS